MRSVWLRSRSGAVGGVAVMAAALGVRGGAAGWPGMIVAAAMAGLFLRPSAEIVALALCARRAGA